VLLALGGLGVPLVERSVELRVARAPRFVFERHGATIPGVA
jgi:hypothetical protein